MIRILLENIKVYLTLKCVDSFVVAVSDRQPQPIKFTYEGEFFDNFLREIRVDFDNAVK